MPLLTPQEFDVAINPKSGAVMSVGVDTAIGGLKDVFGARAREYHSFEGHEFASAVSQWASAHADGQRGLVILGGDGTIKAAAERLANSNIVMGALPGGTFCIVAGRLGYAGDFMEAAKQTLTARAAQVDIASVNGDIFMFGDLLDANGVGFCEAREQLREKHRFGALAKIFSVARDIAAGPVTELEVNGELFSTRLAAVSNGAISPRPNHGLNLATDGKAIALNALATGDMNDGQVAFYALRSDYNLLNPFKSKSLFNAFMDGTWTDHRAMVKKAAPELFISYASDTPAQIPIILDGETVQVVPPLHFRNAGKLKVYLPAR
jgi:diacylglycerol kinase family enzyme